MKISKILYFYLFSRPGSIARIFWPSREERHIISGCFKDLKSCLGSKIIWAGIGIFLLCWISDILVTINFPAGKVFSSFFPGIYLTSFYHRTSVFISIIVVLALIRVLIFLRFKTWWRTNKFLDIGFSMLLGAILARIKDFSGSVDWIQLGSSGYAINLIDVFFCLGLLFLMIGVIICPKMHYAEH